MLRDQAELGRYLIARMRTPFGWAPPNQDCCDFVFGGVKALTGVDHWKRERARYASARGAARVLKRLGGVEGIADRFLTPIAPAMAQRGDVGMILALPAENARPEPTLVLVEGEVLWGVWPDGLRPMPRRLMIKAWSATPCP